MEWSASLWMHMKRQHCDSEERIEKFLEFFGLSKNIITFAALNF